MLKTPYELMEQTVDLIETERKIQRIQQKELALKADIPLPTYKQFIYKKKISLENLFKLLIALRMFDRVGGLVKPKEQKTLDEIKAQNRLPKRVVR